MCPLKLKELDFSKTRNWIGRAENEQENDPIYSFISAWIGFNYYYSTFAKAYNMDFISWIETNRKRKGDKSQWLFLINHEEFNKFFDNFKKRHPDVFKEKISLPIENMLNGMKVPDGLSGEFELNDLKVVQIFSTIYQIRNNLFHGDKDPDKDKRDMQLSILASKFMVSFLNELIDNTYGEVKNIHKT